MMITNQEDIPPKYTDYDSLLQLFDVCVNRYPDNILMRCKTTDDTLKFKELTYSQVDIIATYLANVWKSEFGSTTNYHRNDGDAGHHFKNKDPPTRKPCIAILTENSAQALLAFFATLKIKFIYVLLFSFDSDEANIHILKESKTAYFVASETNREKANKYAQVLRNRDGIDIQVYNDPFDIDTMLISGEIMTTDSIHQLSGVGDEDSNTNYSLDTEKRQTFSKENPLDIVTYMPTTGSTGLPKVIPFSTRSLLFTRLGGGILNLDVSSNDVVMFPAAWITGVEIMLLSPIMLTGASMVLFGHKQPVISEVLATIEMCDVTLMSTVPVVLERVAEFFKSVADDDIGEHYSTILRGIKSCLSYGAQLQIPVGDYLRSKGLNVLTFYGTTETTSLSIADLSKDGNRWSDITPTPEMMRYITFEPYGANLYHLIIHSNFPSLAKGAGNRPNGDYATRDLFTRNERESSSNDNNNSWTLLGRLDDVFNTNLGELVIPGTIEKDIIKEEIILQCTVVGDGRECLSVLVELNFEKAIQHSPVQIVAKVYEAVNQTNTYAFAHAMIQIPQMVYILPFNKQLPKTRKGTVKRKEAIALFEQEIEQMYKNVTFE